MNTRNGMVERRLRNPIKILTEYFNETEYRIWRRDVDIPAPVYNGSHRELFDCIDELIFEESTELQQESQPINWDEFLGVVSKDKSVVDDDWSLVCGAYELFKRNGAAEIDIMIERKEILQEWVRETKHHPAALANSTNSRVKAIQVLEPSQWK